MQVYCGSTGKIIGPKGSKIQEIKKATNVKDIKMPEKSDGPDRPRARDLVEITLIGKPRAIGKAREMIQQVVDEWVRFVSPTSLPFFQISRMKTNSGTTQANAPRPPRDGGFQAQTFTQDPVDYSGGDNNTGDNWEKNGTAQGGDSWEMNGGGGGAETAPGGWVATSGDSQW
jgi:hypothetical protein